MKKILLLLLMLAAAPVFAQTGFNPVGKWETVDNDDDAIMYMTFDAEGYVSIQKGDEIIGGKSFEMDGMKAQMTYKFTPGTNHIDFIMKDLDSGVERPAYGIYKVISQDEVIIDADDSQRPENLSGDALTLKRVKK